MPNPACVAYEAYREAWNKTATNNTYMLGWEYLSSVEKGYWWKVVEALFSKAEA